MSDRTKNLLIAALLVYGLLAVGIILGLWHVVLPNMVRVSLPPVWIAPVRMLAGVW